VGRGEGVGDIDAGGIEEGGDSALYSQGGPLKSRKGPFSRGCIKKRRFGIAWTSGSQGRGTERFPGGRRPTFGTKGICIQGAGLTI